MSFSEGRSSGVAGPCHLRTQADSYSDSAADIPWETGSLVADTDSAAEHMVLVGFAGPALPVEVDRILRMGSQAEHVLLVAGESSSPPLAELCRPRCPQIGEW